MSDAFWIEAILWFIIASTFFGLLRGISKATKETARNTKEMLQILKSVDGKILNPDGDGVSSEVPSADNGKGTDTGGWG